MPKPVNKGIAPQRRKPRTRRVNGKKDVKIDTRVEIVERDRFNAACDRKNQVRAKVLRRLLAAYADAVDAGAPLDGELEVRQKHAPPSAPIKGTVPAAARDLSTRKRKP